MAKWSRVDSRRKAIQLYDKMIAVVRSGQSVYIYLRDLPANEVSRLGRYLHAGYGPLRKHVWINRILQMTLVTLLPELRKRFDMERDCPWEVIRDQLLDCGEEDLASRVVNYYSPPKSSSSVGSSGSQPVG